MNFYQIVGLVTQGWVFAARRALRGPVREPFLVLAALQLLLLLALGNFHAPGLVPVFGPVVRILGGEAATHYPQHFWLLPGVMRTAGLAVSMLVAPFAFAVATARFAGQAGPWSQTSRQAGALLFLALLGPGVAWGVASLFDLIPRQVLLRGFIVRMGLQGIELGLLTLCYSALAYVLCFLVLGRQAIATALVSSFRLTRSLLWPTLLLIAAPMCVLFPFNFFLLEMDLSQSGLAPEAIGLLLAGRSLLQLLLSLLVVGSTTHVWLRMVGGPR